MTKIKQTPITIENFLKEIFPKISSLIDTKNEELRIDLESKINHLPTKEEYFTREDKTMNELKKLREEVQATNNLYKKTNLRVDIVDNKLGIDTSTVF